MSPKTKLAVFSVAVIVFLSLLLLLQSFQEENELSLFVTGNTEGYLVPCGCRTSPAGGLSRRVTVMEKAEAENPSRRIIPIELPNLFMDRGPARDLINRALGDFLTRRGYIIGLGGRDLELGSVLKGYLKQDCYLAGVEGFKDEKVIELGGYRFLPFGKRGRLHLLFLSELNPAGGHKDPVTLFKEKVKAFPGEAFVVLGNMRPETVQDLLKEKTRELLAVVATSEHTVTSAAQRADRTWVIYLGDKGRRYTMLEIGYFDGKWDVWPKSEYLKKDIEADPEEEEIIQRTILEAEKINKAELEKVRSGMPAGAFKGSLFCGKCHQKEYEIWKGTSHSSATGVLEIDHQENNPSCLVCHTTGFGRGGYPNENADFHGVGCESCHGAAEGHPSKPVSGLKDASKGCVSCHTKRDSPDFNEESFFILIDHSAKKTKR